MKTKFKGRYLLLKDMQSRNWVSVESEKTNRLAKKDKRGIHLFPDHPWKRHNSSSNHYYYLEIVIYVNVKPDIFLCH